MARGKSNGSKGKKRKHSGGGRRSSPKKRRSEGPEDDDYPINISDDDMDEDIDTDNESGTDSDKEPADGSDDEDNDAKSPSESDAENGSDTEEEVSVDSLKARIGDCQRALKAAREHKSQSRKERKAAVDRLATLKKNLARLQREKNAFCSLKRSEVSQSFTISVGESSRQVFVVLPRCAQGGFPNGLERS